MFKLGYTVASISLSEMNEAQKLEAAVGFFNNEQSRKDCNSLAYIYIRNKHLQSQRSDSIILNIVNAIDAGTVEGLYTVT
jgi:hypothetical protein